MLKNMKVTERKFLGCGWEKSTGFEIIGDGVMNILAVSNFSFSKRHLSKKIAYPCFKLNSSTSISEVLVLSKLRLLETVKLLALVNNTRP